VSDFYDRLKQSILERGIGNADERGAVYAQARRSVIRRLWAHHPPLAAEEIDQRLGKFDLAIERIEAELTGAVVGEEEDAEPAAEDLAELDIFESPDGEDTVRAEPDEQPQDVGHHGAGVSALPANDGDPYGAWIGGSSSEEPHDDPTPGADATAAQAGLSLRRRRPTDDDRGAAPGSGDGVRAASTRRVRWSKDPGPAVGARRTLPPARSRPRLGLSEQDKVRLLLGVIGLLAVVLISFIVYLTVRPGEEGVTLPIGVRREVSDAETATRIAAEDLNIKRSFVVFDGQDPTLFETTPDNPVRLDSDAEGGYARIASSTVAAGVKALIGPGLAAEFSGQRVRVTITARSSIERGAATMRFAYQSGLAISHWQTANLSPQYADVGLVWRLPAMNTSASGGHYLLIEPGIPGDGTGVDIRSIRIDVLAGEGR